MLANPCHADEPAKRFLAAMVAGGYYDTAIGYLDHLDQYPGVNEEFKAAAPLEKANVIFKMALQTTNTKKQEQLLDQYQAQLDEFATAANHPRAPEAKMKSAELQLSRAQLALSKPDVSVAAKSDARELITNSAKRFDEVVADLRGKLKAMRGAKVDSGDLEMIQRRNSYQNIFMNSMVKSGRSRRLAAETYKNPGKDAAAKKLLNTAEKSLAEMTDKYSKYVFGPQAAVELGDVRKILGRNEDAIAAYLEVINREGNDPALIPLQLKAAASALDIWASEKEPKWNVINERIEPIFSNADSQMQRLPEMQDLNVAYARAKLKQAGQLEENNGKRKNIDDARARAKKLLLAASRVPGKKRDIAIAMLKEMGIDAAEEDTVDLANPTSLRDAMTAAQDLIKSAQAANADAEKLSGPDKESALADVRKQWEGAAEVLRSGVNVRGDSSGETVARARQMMAFAFINQQRYRESAVVGGFVAKSSSNGDIALDSGLIALTALQFLLEDADEDAKSSIREQIQGLCKFLSQRFPKNPKTSQARAALIKLSILDNDFAAVK
ncbi:MAG: hypothetical protein AAFN70_08835, partial [Planctomycetota bacterium]